MSTPQVGQGAFAVVPTFKGFRKAVTAETDAAAKDSDKGFRRIFSKTGTDSGKQSGQGFKKAFESSSTGFATKSTRELEQAVAKSARAVSTSRLKEQDAAGKVRLAEAQLAEARSKYASDSSQVIRAEERLATAARQLGTAQDSARESTNDLKNAQGNLARAADRAGDELAESGRRGARKFASGFSEIFKGSFFGSALGNIASNVTSQLGYAIGSGIRKGIEFGIGTISIASDLRESVNAVQVSYGDIATEILKLGDTSAKTFGLSTRDLNSYSVQFSAFAKGIAGEGGDVAGTFRSILGRATDFASVMNLEVNEALGLFQSGLAGETEPLRKYGIDLSAAAVEAYALANGIGDGASELTEAQKQQARYGALLAQTSAVQGDFANTSDELANKNRINAATWDDLQAKIGAGFLPVASSLAAILSSQVLPAIDELVTKNGPGLAKMFEDALPAFVEMTEEILPQIPGLLQSIVTYLPIVLENIATMGPPLIELFGKFANGAQQISDFFEVLGGKEGDDSWAKWRNGAQQIIDFSNGLSASLQNGANQIGSFFGSIGASFANGWSQISSFFGNVGREFEALPIRIATVFAGAGRWLFNSGRSIIQGFLDGVGSMFGQVGNVVGGLMDWVRGFFPNSPAKRGPFSGSGWTGLQKSGSAVMQQWTSGFARPDLTGALTPALVGVSGTSAATAAGGAGSAPSTLVVVDQDGQLIGRMRVEARGEVTVKSKADKVVHTGGRWPDA